LRSIDIPQKLSRHDDVDRLQDLAELFVAQIAGNGSRHLSDCSVTRPTRSRRGSN
jgi:hypothetical protein